MAREFIDTAGMWAKSFNEAAGEIQEFMFEDGKDPDQHIKAFRITFASGYEIMALSSKPRSLRGRQGFVIIDEAAFHDDLEELLKAAMALLIWGGKVCVVSTHDGAENPFNELIGEIRAKKRAGEVLRIDLDQALADGLYNRICLVTGKDWSEQAQVKWRQEVIDFYGDAAQEELFCVPRRGGGQPLTRSLIRPFRAQCRHLDHAADFSQRAKVIHGVPVTRQVDGAIFERGDERWHIVLVPATRQAYFFYAALTEFLPRDLSQVGTVAPGIHGAALKPRQQADRPE